jgi:MFS transporter, SP family, sugar:H+ symporter
MASLLTAVCDRTQYFNRRLFLSVSLVALSSLNYGFDNQTFSATEQTTAFQKTFGVLNEKTQT